jgi:hypothetical protein
MSYGTSMTTSKMEDYRRYVGADTGGEATKNPITERAAAGSPDDIRWETE